MVVEAALIEFSLHVQRQYQHPHAVGFARGGRLLPQDMEDERQQHQEQSQGCEGLHRWVHHQISHANSVHQL
jgi:hypothetical protein